MTSTMSAELGVGASVASCSNKGGDQPLISQGKKMLES